MFDCGFAKVRYFSVNNKKIALLQPQTSRINEKFEHFTE